MRHGIPRDKTDPEQTDAGQLLLAQTLLGSERPVTVIATGPLTNLAWVLDNYPEVSSKIDKVLIMGASPSVFSYPPVVVVVAVVDVIQSSSRSTKPAYRYRHNTHLHRHKRLKSASYFGVSGGAIDVPGNVFADDVEGHDGTAEWNIFWDPRAAKRVSQQDQKRPSCGM